MILQGSIGFGKDQEASTIYWCSAYDLPALSQRSSESLQTIYILLLILYISLEVV